jgi:putative flavoprotein involved in K+ transport
MRKITVTIIGAGHAGLAMSHCLNERSIDHVVLERSEVANSWRTERWNSLRLLTPNWLTRLPGCSYAGRDPDGYMTASEVVEFLDGYSRASLAPVETNTTVQFVATSDGSHVVTTDRGQISSRVVIVATGACSTPNVPSMASELPSQITQLAPIHYRHPGDAGDGTVLVVGASASGVQLAEELAQSGRGVTLAVGAHTRLPRTYRGMDIHWWMDALGLLDTRYEEVDDIAKARRLPSLQLVGSPEHRTLDLNSLTGLGVELVGRLVGVSGGRAKFSGSLANVCADADLKMGRLLGEIDTFSRNHGLDADLTDVDRPRPTVVRTPRTTAALTEYSTVVWATGFQPNYPWLHEDLLDPKGRIVHDGGVMNHPGIYVIGLPFTRRRKSSFLDGAGPDARDLTSLVVTHLAGRGSPVAGQRAPEKAAHHEGLLV